MKLSRYSQFLLGMVVLFSLAACAQEGSGTSETFQMPESQLLRFFERKSGRIMYMGLDGNLYSTDQTGSEPVPLTTDAEPNAQSPEYRGYMRFAWAPNNEKIAYVGYDLKGIYLYTAKPDGSERIEAFSSSEELPIFLYWSPSSAYISFLTNQLASTNLKVYYTDAEGMNVPKLLDAGQPYFYIWEPGESNRIFAHLMQEGKNQLMMVSPLSGRETAWTVTPAPFQTPAWSPDGFNLLVAISESAGTGTQRNSLVVTSLSGRVERRVAEIGDSVAFSWSPDGKRIAYISSDRSRGGVLGRLTVKTMDDSKDDIVIEDNFVYAYFWSPNGKKLAYFTLELTSGDTSSGSRTGVSSLVSLNMLDIKTEERTNLLNFFPTTEFREVLQYFDQYQYAASLWSPDSENVVVSAMTNDQGAIIVVVPASGKLQPRLIANGILAFWSWK